MKDTVVHALASEGHIRILVVNLTETVREAQQRHDLWPTASAALGRTMAVGSLMAAQLKQESERISIRIEGDGPLGLIRVDAFGDGKIRGFVGDPHVNLIKPDRAKLDVSKAIGKGTLSVSRNLGLKNEFTSTIDLVSGELGEDFAYYFTQSEQIPSALSVGVLVNEYGQVESAGALLLQMMPGHQEADILMAQHVIENLKPISQIIKEGQLPNDIAKALFDEVEIVAEKEVEFSCDCCKEDMQAALMTLPLEELVEIRHEDRPLMMECQYCNELYEFSDLEVDQMIEEKKHGQH